MAEVAASTNRNQVCMWARNKEVIDSINKEHRNPKFFSDIELNSNITGSTDIEEVLRGADLVLGCLPTQATPAFLEDVKHVFPVRSPFVSCSKGLDLLFPSLI